MKLIPFGSNGVTLAITSTFTEPTSVRVTPGFKVEANSFTTEAIAPTGTQSTIRSAPLTVSTELSNTSHIPNWTAFVLVSNDLEVPVILTLLFSRRNDRAIDDEISPKPIKATCLYGISLFLKFCKSFYNCLTVCRGSD